MSVTLNTQLEERITRLRESGHYADANAVISDALNLLETRQREINGLRAKLQVGLDQLDRGEFVLVTDEFWVDLDREVDEGVLRGDIPDPDVCPK